MGRVLKFGCLGIVAIVLLFVVLAVVGSQAPKPEQTVSGQPAKPGEAAKPAMATVGQTASLGGWDVTLLDFGPYDRFSPSKPPATKAQGTLVVADMRIKNTQNTTSNFTTNDFVLKSGDGREFKAAGQTATIDRGFMITQQVQPGLTTENRVVFDIDPTAKDLVFSALRMQFSVPMPN